jgi:hypothetical protein
MAFVMSFAFVILMPASRFGVGKRAAFPFQASAAPKRVVMSELALAMAAGARALR